MPFAPPQSGWTAMGISPNPDKFAAAHVNIDRVSQPQMQSQRSVLPAPTSPVTSPAYQQIQSQLFGGAPPTNPLAAQQLQAAQATAAPANAFAAVEKSLKADPWVKPLATTPPQSGFLNPSVTKPTTPAPSSGWVPNGLPQI